MAELKLKPTSLVPAAVADLKGPSVSCAPALAELGCCTPQPSCALPELTGAAAEHAKTEAAKARAAIETAVTTATTLEAMKQDAVAWVMLTHPYALRFCCLMYHNLFCAGPHTLSFVR